MSVQMVVRFCLVFALMDRMERLHLYMDVQMWCIR